MNQQRWFHAVRGEQRGPFPLEQLQHLIATGQVTQDDLVWTEGMPQWMPAGQIPILIPNIQSAEVKPVVSYQSGAVTDNLRYAGFWCRALAALVDGVLLLVPVVLASLVIPIAGGIAAAWLYYAVMESSFLQGTPGKLLVGVKVTDMQGQRIGFGQATGRFFAKYISQMTMFIGYMMAGWTIKKQALHDLMASTLVVHRM